MNSMITMNLLTLMKNVKIMNIMNIVTVMNAAIISTKKYRRKKLRTQQMGVTKNFRRHMRQKTLLTMTIGRNKTISSTNMKLKMNLTEMTIMILSMTIFKIV